LYNTFIALTFKDLKKRVTLQTAVESKVLNQLYNKPFWIWDEQKHKLEDTRTKGDCCFNHIVGLPTKGRIEKPIFDYEKLLYDYLLTDEHSNFLYPNHTFKHKHLWVKKATGLGVTEFFLRLMAWLFKK
jgi:hypothetical protein